MVEERLDTTNKIIIPGDGNFSSEGTKEDIIKGLKDLTPEEMDIAAKRFDEEKEREEIEERREREERERKKLEKYREAWREKIKISDESKEKIIKAAKNINVNIETDEEGSRLIEFEIWWKEWKILDPILNNHTDDDYRYGDSYDAINEITRAEVELIWMMWDNVDNWENKELAEYVKQKEREWLHIAKIEEMKDLLEELWDAAYLNDEGDQIALLMYLTGMDWFYRLSMWDDESSNSWESSRSCLDCSDEEDNRNLCCYDGDEDSANLCMIAY